MKKKLLFFAMCLFAFTGNLMAQTIPGKGDIYYKVEKTDIMPNHSEWITFYYSAGEDQDFRGFQVELTIPDGFTVVKSELGPEVAEHNPDMALNYNERDDGNAKPTNVFLGVQTNATTSIPAGKDIELFCFLVESDENIAEGEYPFTTTHCELADMKTGASYHVDPKTMILNVVPIGPRVLVDTDRHVPEPSKAPEDVIVKRTVKADVWSTLTLPFPISGEEFVEIFGANAKVADFIRFQKNDLGQYVMEFEQLDPADGIDANYPYLIKSENALTEFTVKDGEIDADPENAFVEYDNGGRGSKRVVYATMYGTMQGNTKVPEDFFLLRDNKFYVSTGNSTINAFRAYFNIAEYVYGGEGEGANITFIVNDEATAIDGLYINGQEYLTGDVYNVNGTYMGKAENVMSKLPRGVYIVNNKKVVVK